MIRQVPPCPRGGLKCSAAQLGPKGQKKTKCGNSQRSPELLALVMESVGASSPGTFLGSLDAFQLYLYFQKCQLVYMTRAEEALLQRCVIEEWRGSGLPVFWSSRQEVPELMAGSRKRVRSNCRSLRSQLRVTPSSMKMHRWHYISGELCKAESKEQRILIWGSFHSCLL